MCDPESDVHDDMLFSMLKDCKALPVFLDHIFGFLQRRTDFYHIAKDPQSPVGLPEGFAESLVKHAYFKWKPRESIIFQENEVPSAIIEEVVTTTEDPGTTSDLDLVSTMESIDIGSDSNFQQLLECKDEHNFGFSNSECYNGSAYENYCWSQTITEVDVIIKVPESIKAKDIKVDIQTNTISIKLKEQEVLLEGTLCQKCKNNDAIWSIDKQKLQIHLDKCREMWWDCLITSENKLDLTKIDCSRPYEELPDDAKARIEELNWNQERKRLGLPTSDQLANEELLRKAWNAEGSPFSGPFDPAQVKFN